MDSSGYDGAARRRHSPRWRRLQLSVSRNVVVSVPPMNISFKLPFFKLSNQLPDPVTAWSVRARHWWNETFLFVPPFSLYVNVCECLILSFSRPIRSQFGFFSSHPARFYLDCILLVLMGATILSPPRRTKRMNSRAPPQCQKWSNQKYVSEDICYSIVFCHIYPVAHSSIGGVAGFVGFVNCRTDCRHWNLQYTRPETGLTPLSGVPICSFWLPKQRYYWGRELCLVFSSLKFGPSATSLFYHESSN